MIVARNALSLNLKVPAKGASTEARLDRDTDEALVASARGGDFSAFERLFERHRSLVYRFVFQMSNRRDDAEDLTQEVFVRAYQNLHRYRDEAKFTTWLLRIATNLATDKARMAQRRMTLENQESGSQGALAWMTVGTTDDPVENLEQSRRLAALRNALATLPDHHRNVIVLRDIEEMDYKDMAAVLGCTVGGAKLRVLRARRALKERVLSMMDEEVDA